jgi:alkanesulfonate monooxygenase SsuD/methylene tetrahydromethanopterin reductase-like flavin-dependent oxidoreductase (luciferase family)
VSRVKVGVTLKMYEYATLRPKPLADIGAQARRAEALGFDSVWVMDHLFIQRGERRVLAHDPMVSLAHVAAVTSRIQVGSMVLCHGFRHAGQLAREASALADSSSGRFVLGLGAGWHRPEFDALGLPYDHKVGRLEEAVGPLLRLLAGESVSVDGEWLQLSAASVAVTSKPPPLWIAADGPRMLALAARVDGWSHSNWGAADTRPFREAVARFDRELDSAGRSRDDVEVSVSIACAPGGWRRMPGGFQEEEVAEGPLEELAGIIDGYAQAGAQHVILSLSPDPYAELDPDRLEAAAPLLKMV